MNLRGGFVQTNDYLVIAKDVEAQLIYTFDWSQWLAQGDSIATAEYSVSARRNEPTPIIIESQGLNGANTYVELSGGAEDKTYIVTCKVTTTNGLVDRRSFRVNVSARSA
jgi:hypothetical protein